MDSALLELFLPDGVLDYFEVISVDKRDDSFQIYLHEKNIIPKEYSGQKLLSKGFYDESIIQDFPIRGKACYLKVKRRRWTIEPTGEIVFRNWSLVAKGTRLTEEFASFLKNLHRQYSGKL
jgi:hypothetical protein